MNTSSFLPLLAVALCLASCSQPDATFTDADSVRIARPRKMPARHHVRVH